MKTVQEFEALIEFYAANDLDYALDENPHNRFEEVRQKRAVRLQQQTSLPAAQQILTPPTNTSGALQRSPSSKAAPLIAPTSPPQVLPDAATMQDARKLAESAKNLEELKELLSHFEGCNLKRTAKNLVFGDGSPNAKIMFIGEAPGRDEDINGLPFVGRSGLLLDKMLAAIGLLRARDVYIANSVPWRPPGNRTPTPLESELCRPFIERQITLVKPKILVPLGAPATRQLLKTKEGIMKMRGKIINYQLGDVKIKAIATLHPAYLLRQPAQKRLVWQDLLKIKNLLKDI